MKEIEGYKIEYDFSEFKKIADLIWYQGPLLAHYVSPHGDDYLFYWCDCDDSDNRWLVFRVNLPTLLQYIAKSVTLREIIMKANDGYLYMVDIDDNLNYHNVKLVQPANLPEDYIPEEDSYYEFEPMPTEDAAELLTYELTIPYQDRTKFEQLLSHFGQPFSSLKKLVNKTAIF